MYFLLHRNFARKLADIGDLFNDQCKQEFEELLVHTPREQQLGKYINIGIELFKDKINWGRIGVFILLGIKVAMQCGNEGVSWQQKVLECIVSFILDKLINWIVKSGGWVSYF